MIATLLLLGLVGALPAQAQTDDPERDDAGDVAGIEIGTVIYEGWRVTGEPETGLRLTAIRTSRVLDAQHILFEVSPGRQTYINRMDYRCGGLTINRSFAYDTRINRLTNLDIIDVLQPIGGGLQRLGSCGLGKFYPVERIEETDDDSDDGDNGGDG